MPPQKRQTANTRHFQRSLTSARYDLGHRETPLEDLPANDVREVLNDVISRMKNDPNVVFYNNVGGGRVPISDSRERNHKLLRFIRRACSAALPADTKVTVVAAGDGSPWVRTVSKDHGDGRPDGRPEDRPTPDAGETPDEQPGEQPGEPDDQPADGDSPAPPPPQTPAEHELAELQLLAQQPDPDDGTPSSEFHKWWRILTKLRRYCRDAAEHGIPIDDLASYRPVVMGASMIRQGITADACADACTAHWPDDARSELGIEPVVPHELFPPVADEHPATQYMLRLMAAKVPVMLHGGAGVGKTTLARDVANALNLPFGMVSMTAGLSTTALTGSVNLQGFVTRPCVDTFINGGVFLFDELDAGDPNLLLICNTMLANDEFQSPVTGERHIRHHRWYPIAAVNTLNGATTSYTGRSRLDHATMDRWRMGRIRLDFAADQALTYGLQALNGQ